MPRAKRPLAEADRNANLLKFAKTTLKQNPGGKSVERNVGNTKGDTRRVEQTSTSQPSPRLPKSSAKLRIREPKSRYSTQLVVDEEKHSGEAETPAAKEAFDYSTKDNNKLRLFLSERSLPTSGTREELIARLDNSSIDYESLPSWKITEMLKARHVTSYGHGPKDYKIARLRINDKLDHDTGNSPSRVLYGSRSAMDDIEGNAKRDLEALTKDSYASMAVGPLSAALEKKGLSASGSKKALVARLYNHEKKALSNSLDKVRAKIQDLDQEMEETIGHPVPCGVVFQEIEQERADTKILDEQGPASFAPESIRKHQQGGSSAIRKEVFDYSTKDDSKLRAFLVDRHLPTEGTREELIARLESSSIDYESLLATELSEILSRRHVTGAATGTKEIKIQRIRLNDKIDYNTGDSHATILYVHRDVSEEAIVEMEQKLQALSENPYATLTPKQLVKKLEKQNLSSTGSKEVMAKRLWNHEKKDVANKIKLRKEKLKEIYLEMESYIGHPVKRGIDTQTHKEKNEEAVIQHEMLASRKNAVPVCEYNWKDSHWADRTEQQLSEICSRRGMPGHGPKAAMLKWLDTGKIDYQDMYVGGLTKICHERGIVHKESDKKAVLVRRLNEADEAEASG